MAYAIDRNRVSQIGEYGYEPAANQTGIVTPTFSSWLDTGLAKQVTYNQSKAVSILKAAGFKMKGGVFHTPQGKPLSFTMINIGGYSDWVASAQVVQQELKAVGYPGHGPEPLQHDLRQRHVQRQVPARLRRQRSAGGRRRTTSYARSSTRPNSAPIGKLAASNWERYSNPAVDKLIDSYGATTDTATQHAIIRKLEQVMVNDVPVIPVTESVDWYQYNTKGLSGWVTPQNPYARPSASRIRTGVLCCSTSSQRDSRLGKAEAENSNRNEVCAAWPRCAHPARPRDERHSGSSSEACAMRFVFRRLGFFVITLWAAVTLNFLIPRLMPGNAAVAMMARYRGRVNPQALHALEIAFGVKTHQSLFGAYFSYLGNMLRGRFGTSLTFFPDAVSHQVLQALPWTLALVGVTTILAFVLGTLDRPRRRVASRRRARQPAPADLRHHVGLPVLLARAARDLDLLDQARPGCRRTAGTTTRPRLPGRGPSSATRCATRSCRRLTILVTSIGGWILTMRNNMIAVLSEDYVRMARAKGLHPWRIMWTYAGRNAILPNLTGFAMSLGFVVSGAILVEFVFNYPGVGWMLLQAVENQDFALMQALFLLIVVAVLTAILAADVATALLDPRTREQR